MVLDLEVHEEKTTGPSPTQAEQGKPPQPEPSDGEQAFAWFFCLVYLSIMAGVVGVMAYFVVTTWFTQVPTPIGVLLAVMVFGMLPHARQAIVEELVKTRGMNPVARLGRLIATMHA